MKMAAPTKVWDAGLLRSCKVDGEASIVVDRVSNREATNGQCDVGQHPLATVGFYFKFFPARRRANCCSQVICYLYW